MKPNLSCVPCLGFLAAFAMSALAQDNPPPFPGNGPPRDNFFGGGPPMGGAQEDFPLLEKFDKDKKGYLNLEERRAAREFLAKEKAEGRGPRQGPGGGRGGRGGFGPGGMLAPAMLAAGDGDKDAKLTKEEFASLAETWYGKLDPDKTGSVKRDDFVEKFAALLPAPGEGGGGQGGRRGGGARFLGPGVFDALDGDKSGEVTLEEMKSVFGKWHEEWDVAKSGGLDEGAIRAGLGKVLPMPNFGGPGGPGGRGGRGGGNRPPASPGPTVSSEEAPQFPDSALYDPKVFRTFFFELEEKEWPKELADFKGTDVEVPAKLTVDGKTYPNVGMSYRGASSYFMVGETYKRSLNVTMDLADKDQRLHGAKTLNLLNANGDPTFLRGVLYNHVARQYLPALKANLARVVVNGESWGVYVSVEQFNGDFVKDHFDSKKGARWKVPGSPRGKGGLEYLGDDVAKYKAIYEIKSKDDPKSWEAFIRLCKVLNETPADKLEAALEPIFDVDGALRFLALENVFINEDGYWTRASDYNICQDKKGRFHIVPHDTNETFHTGGGFGGPGGPGFGGPGGPGGDRPRDGDAARPDGERPGRQDGDRPRNGGGGRRGGVELDPLVAVEDADKPLLSKLLAVPSLRERYLAYVKDIADKWLDWNKLGPLAKELQALVSEQVKLDTRKLASFEAFEDGVDSDEPGGRELSLKQFADQRRKFLLSYDPAKRDEGER